MRSRRLRYWDGVRGAIDGTHGASHFSRIRRVRKISRCVGLIPFAWTLALPILAM